MPRPHVWLFAAAFALLAAPALAEEDAGPAYGASDLAVEEDTLPDGWSVVYDELEDTPGEAIEEWATQVARGAGVEEEALYYETRVLESPEKAHATLLLVEVDGDAGTLPQKLARAAEGEGWMSRQMGHPTRLLVLAAPDSIRQKTLDLQMKTSVATLTRLANERQEAGSLVGARAYVDGALALEPKAGMPNAVLGLIAMRAEEWEDAIEAFEKAFAKDALHQPEGELEHRSWRTFGYVLLQLEKREYDERAVEALERAIATAGVLKGREQVFAIHYNLACALSRLKRTQEACDRLETALDMAKKRLGPGGFGAYLNRTVKRDADLDNIRGKPCYEKVLERVTKGVATSPLDGI